MGDEMLRHTLGDDITADDINLLATMFVPRHTRGTLLFVKAGLSVGHANQQLDGIRRWLALVPTIMTEAEVNIYTGSNMDIMMSQLKPIDIDMFGITDIGTSAAEQIPFNLKFERDFENISSRRVRALGLALKSAGPSANRPIGWSLINGGFDETLDFSWYLIVEVLIEWPKNNSMRWLDEHIANEENQ